MATSPPATSFDPKKAVSTAMQAAFPGMPPPPADPTVDFSGGQASPAVQPPTSRLDLLKTLLAPDQRDISGHQVDPLAPTGLDWLKQHGPGAHSWDAGQPMATLGYNGPAAARAENASAYRPSALDTASVHQMRPDETPKPATTGGVPMAQFFVQHEHPGLSMTGGTPQEYAKDFGQTLPPGVQVPDYNHDIGTNPATAEEKHQALLRSAHPSMPHGAAGAGFQQQVNQASQKSIAGTQAQMPKVNAQSVFQPMKDITQGNRPIPETGVVPAVGSNMLNVLGNAWDNADTGVGNILMKLFGTRNIMPDFMRAPAPPIIKR